MDISFVIEQKSFCVRCNMRCVNGDSHRQSDVYEVPMILRRSRDGLLGMLVGVPLIGWQR